MAAALTFFTLLACSLAILSGVDARGRNLLQASANAQFVRSTKVGSKTVYNITWTQVAPNAFEDILAQCGDEVIFNWSGDMHDVGIATDSNCGNIDTILAPPANSGSYRVVLDNKIKSIREDGEVYFACSLGLHCAKGKQSSSFTWCVWVCLCVM